MPISNNDFNNISMALETNLPITVKMCKTNNVCKSELSN